MGGVGVEDWGWGNRGWSFSQTRVTLTSNRAPSQLLDMQGKASDLSSRDNNPLFPFAQKWASIDLGTGKIDLSATRLA